MSDEPENLVLALVRQLDRRTGTLSAGIDHMLGIVGKIEQGVAEVKIEIASLHAGCNKVNRTLDRIDAKLDRIQDARWAKA